MKPIRWLILGLVLITGCIHNTPILDNTEIDMEITPVSCMTHNDCPAGSYCDECTGSSCLNCDDCIPGCLSACESEVVADCDLERPTCFDTEVSVIRDGCWQCVDQVTCSFSEVEADCRSDQDCAIGQYCNQCATSSCPVCEDCVALCQDSPCDSEEVAVCDLERPLCEEGFISVIRDGCWQCVDRLSCEPIRSMTMMCNSNQDCWIGQYCDPCATASCEGCNDCIGLCRETTCETEPNPSCRSLPPVCAESELLVVRSGCWQCVDQVTCEPSQVQETTCSTNSDCDVGSYCDECATSSCPSCADCIGLCTVSSCESEAQAVCEEEPPSCDSGTVLIIQDGCWLCVDITSCEAMSVEPPLNRCESAADCSFGSICDPCAGSSCPSCDDCISACRPVCDSADNALCNTLQPECDESQVLIVRDRCWLCVDQLTCEP